MTIKLLYQGQIKDPSGYAVAGRGYVKSIIEYINSSEQDYDLKIIAISADEQNCLTEEEKQMIAPYEFNNQEEIVNWLKSGDYHYAFHHPPTYAVKIPVTRDVSANSLTTTCLTVWETDSIPPVWDDLLEHLDVDKIVVPCEWNREAFDGFGSNRPVTVVPHLINDSFIEKGNEQEVPEVISENEFTILTVGQWTDRKALQNVIKAYFMEFKEQEDCTLIVKTYGNIQDSRPEYQEYQKNEMIRQIKMIKNAMLTPSLDHAPKCKLHFLYGLLPKGQMNYLYQNSDLFALLSRAEGFGLPIAEALAYETPVLVHSQGGHVGFVDPESSFIVDCYKTPSYCTIFPLVYTCDSNWFETDFYSARKALRAAYDAWKAGKLPSRGKAAKQYMFNVTADPLVIGKSLVETITRDYEHVVED
jgi:glycosyltransferase involved in cell wall biosynthesis